VRPECFIFRVMVRDMNQRHIMKKERGFLYQSCYCFSDSVLIMMHSLFARAATSSNTAALMNYRITQVITKSTGGAWHINGNVQKIISDNI